MKSIAPCSIKRSRPRIELTINSPTPGSPNRNSTSTAPEISWPTLRPASVSSENDDGRRAWPEQHPPRRQALGPGDRDEVLLQRRDHVAAQEAGVDRDLQQTQRQGRQDQRLDVADRVLREPREAGDLEPAERHREDVDQQQAEHEAGDGDGGEGDARPQPVEGAAGPIRGEHADRDGDHEGEHLSEDHQLERHGDALRQGLGDGLAGAVRLAEVAPQDVAEPVEVGDEDVLVEAHLLAEQIDLLLRGLGPEEGAGRDLRGAAGPSRTSRR